jgi:hypothetical protein
MVRTLPRAGVDGFDRVGGTCRVAAVEIAA